MYKQFGRASKLLLHPKDVPDIKLPEKEETINREIQNEGEENTTLCELLTDEKISEEPTNQLGNKGPLDPTVKWTVTGRCVFPSEDSEKLLYHLGDQKCETLLSYGGKERHTEMNTDNNRIVSEKSIIRYNTVKGNLQEMSWTSCIQEEYQLSEGVGSEKGEKSIIRCSTVTGSPQEMKVTPYSKGDYRLSEGNSIEESINRTCQAEYKQGLKEDSNAMTVTLCEVQCRNSENLINQLKRSDEKQLDQMVTPVHIPACTCYQTDPNKDVAKKTEEFNKVDLQQGWGKTVSFITSNKLSLTNALHSLAQIPVVTKIDRNKENDLGEQNDLDNVGLISDSSYTFFL